MGEHFSKYVGVAKITDPADVESQCNTYGFAYKPGAIFCHIPGLGLEGTNYVYCRYGLAFPYLRIQKDWKVLVEPTITERSGTMKNWFYTGLVDCGGTSGVTPDTDMQMLIQLVTQVIYASADQIRLGNQNADEPLVLGDALQAWIEDFITNVFNAHIHTTTATIGAGATPGVISPPSNVSGTNPTDILSTTVFTE